MPTASPPPIERIDHDSTVALLADLQQLLAAQRRSGNDLASVLTADAIRVIRAQNHLLNTQGALIDALAARPPVSPRWLGTRRHRGRKTRR
jgi:hypothetical protein